MYYSKTTGGFYSVEINGLAMPSDVIALSLSAYTNLLQGQSTGQSITTDAQGMPLLAIPPIPTHAELVTAVLTYARSLRASLFTVVDGLQASALALANGADATAIETFKAGLRNITKIDLSLATTDVQMRALVLAQYKALAIAAPASVQLAFAQAVQ